MLTGNHEFNGIYKEYKNLVLKAAYTYSGDYETAKDITQDTFLKLYIYYEHLRKDNIRAWLYTTAKNTALNYKKKSEKEILKDEENENSEGAEELSGRDVAEEYYERILGDERRRLHEKIFEDLMRKNPRWYEGIMLAYYMEIPQAEVAEMMGIRIQVLHSMLSRARKWIKKKYGVEYEEMNREG